jgi:hypothetical protein
MVIPLKVWNRLRRGYDDDVAAEVPATRPGFRAWVYITPIRDLKMGNWGALHPPDVNGRTLAGFVVRRLEVSEECMPYIYESNWFLDKPSTRDEIVTASDESQLEGIVSSWLDDNTDLRDPTVVSCPNLQYDSIKRIGGTHQSYLRAE